MINREITSVIPPFDKPATILIPRACELGSDGPETSVIDERIVNRYESVISYLCFGVCTTAVISILSHITLCADAEDGDGRQHGGSMGRFAVLFAHITGQALLCSESSVI